MGRLCQTEGLTDIQQEILRTVRDFVDREILPVATELEHKDEYPTQIVEGLKELGVFGLMIPEEYGGLGESLLTYALAVEEIARGWMSVSGIINTHFIVAWMLLQHGTEDKLTDPSGSRLVADLAGSDDVTLKMYDGLYHEVFNEYEKEKVLDDLTEWLKPRLAA